MFGYFIFGFPQFCMELEKVESVGEDGGALVFFWQMSWIQGS